MIKNTLKRGLFVAVLVYGLLACKADYTWHNDVVDFVDDGLSAVLLQSTQVQVESLSLDHFVPGYRNTVNLKIINPRNFDVDYTLIEGPDLILVPNISFIAPDHPTDSLEFYFDATEAAKGKTLRFVFNVDVPGIERDFDPIVIEKVCAFPDSPLVVSVSLPGTGSTNLVFAPARLSIPIDTPITLQPKQSLPLTDTPDGAWNWFVNGNQVDAQTSGTFTPDTANVGTYRITATCNYNEVLYSGDFTLEITANPTYTVTYDSAGGVGGPGDEPTDYRAGDTVTVLDQPTKAGYYFGGWRTHDLDPDGDGDVDLQTFSFDDIFIMQERNVKLTAIWNINTQTVTNLTAKPGDALVQLTWQEPSESRPDRYEVTWTPAGPVGSTPQPLTVRPGLKAAAILGLTNGTPYTFTVKAIYYPLAANASAPPITATPGNETTFAEMSVLPVATSVFRPADTYDQTLNPFSLSRYELTYKRWYAVKQWAEANGYTFTPNSGQEGSSGMAAGLPQTIDLPVSGISWRDAIVWCNALSDKEGLTPVYYSNIGCTEPIKTSTTFDNLNTNFGSIDNPYVNWEADGYRLPTEAEWEYAARYINGASWQSLSLPSGAQSDANEEYRRVAVYDANSANKAWPVGSKAANQAGFFDMSGNIAEWCWDTKGSLPTAPQVNYRSDFVESASTRMIRGGSCLNAIGDIVGSARTSQEPWLKSVDIGLRLARTVTTYSNYETYAYVLCRGSTERKVKTYAIDTTNGQLTFKQNSILGVSTDIDSGRIIVNPQGGRLYYSLGVPGGTTYGFFPINAMSGNLGVESGTNSISDYALDDFIFSPAGDRLFAGLTNTNSFSTDLGKFMTSTLLVDTTTGLLTIHSIPLSSEFGPTHLIQGNKSIFVSSFATNEGTTTLHRMEINTANGTMSSPTGIGMFGTYISGMVRIGSSMYILRSGGVNKGISRYTLSNTDGTSLNQDIPLTDFTHLKATPDGRFLLAANKGQIRVYAINLRSGALTQVGIETPTDAPENSKINLNISPDSRYLYLTANGDSKRILIFRIANDGRLSSSGDISLSSGEEPIDIAFTRFPRP